MQSEPIQVDAPRRAGARPVGVAAVRWAAGAAAVVALLGAGALIWYDRHTIVAEATATTERRAGRLATEVAQALDLSRVVVEGLEGWVAQAAGRDIALALVDTALAEQAPVLAALPIPVAVRPVLEGDAQVVPAERRWHPQATRDDGKGLVIPLVRPAAPNPHGVRGWLIALDHAALVARFEASRLPRGGGVALFRIEADGATTVLARAPFDRAELGRTVRGPLAEAVARAPRGHFDTVTQLDEVRRLVAYERVDAQGVPLVIGYGVATATLLAPWYQLLPWVAATLLVLLGAGAAGTHRLTQALATQARQGEALARSERDFRALADNLPDVVVRFDPEGRHLYANPGVERATGLPPEAFIGRTNAELGMPADKVAVWMEALRRVFASGGSERLEFSYPGPQGERHWESVVTLEPAVAGGGPTALVISRDISDRKQAGRALHESEERLRLALEAASQGLYDLDLRTGQAVVSPEYARMLGWEPEDFDESNAAWLERLHPDDRAAVEQAFQDYVAGRRRDYRVEFRQRMRDGGWKWILSVGRIQERDADGAPLRMLGTHTDLDAIKAAQAAQAAATQRFEKLFESAPEAISVSELESGRFLQVNDAFCELFGHARDAVIGRTSAELGMWTEVQAREEIVARLSAGEPVHGFEGLARRGAQETIDVMFSAERIELDGRDCLLLMFRDISQRKRLETSLRASEARLAYLLERAPTGIYTARPSGDYGATYYSPNMWDLVGWAPERFVAEPSFWLDHIHPDDRPGVLREFEALATRDELVLEYRFQHSDGRWLWMRDQVSLQRDASGAPLEIIGAWIDITARREAEDAARRLAAELEQRVRERTAQLGLSEARYRNIFETVPVAIGEEDWSDVQRLLRSLRARGVEDGPGHFAARPDFVHECLQAVKVRRLNRQGLALHDFAGASTQPADLRPFFPTPADEAQFVEELVAMWSGQRLLTAKRLLTSMVGRPLRLMMTMSLPGLDDEDGTALVCLVDITEIDRLNAELDRSVARLTQVNRELETFTYSVSHDLKAPLRGIDGYSRLLLSDHQAQLDDEGRRFLGHIRQATQHMGVLIDDLLAYSRLERRDLLMAALSPAEVVDSALRGLRADLAAAGVALEVAVDPSLRVRGDAQGLVMALRNLVDNAFKFSRNGTPPRITIAAERVDGAIRLSVRDNGIGFDMKFHDRIFSIFQRLHRAEDYPGTGIGLAIVRKAVDRMGGHAWAESRPDQGATFTIELPEAS